MIASSPAFRSRWLVLPAAAGAALVPGILLLLAWAFFNALKRHHEGGPFLCAIGFFGLSYVGLGISLYPMMVPPRITLWEAAAPASTQAFLLVGAAVMVPVILIYTSFVYWLFRGKVKAGSGYHST
jgi:cytochrome d ubiquinol oxidase subunit II